MWSGAYQLHQPITSSLLPVIFTFVLLGAPAAGGTDFVVHSVLSTHEPVPGDPNGSTWTANNSGRVFWAPVINDRTEVAFLAAASDGLDYDAYYANIGGSIQRVARAGDVLPGINAGETLQLLKELNLNNAGQIAFSAYALSGSGAGDQAWWLWDNSSTKLIMRENTPAPGFPGPFVNVGPGPYLALNQTGRVALAATALDASTNAFSSIWRGKPGTLAPLLVPGQMAPGSATNFAGASAIGQVIAGNSSTVIPGTLEPFFNLDIGLWLEDGDSLQPLAVPHQPLPEVGPNVAFKSFADSATSGQPGINSSGQFVAVLALEGPGVGTSNQFCLITGTAAGRTSLARSGDPVPGLAGLTYTRFQSAVINSQGDVAVIARMRDAAAVISVALCVARGGTLHPVLRTSGPAPGFAPDIAVSTLLAGPYLNRLGQTLLVGEVQGPGINPSQNSAIWLVEPTLELRLVAWPGMTATLSNGQGVTLNALGYGVRPPTLYCADDDGRAGMLNDRGEFVFVGNWTAGVGVFVGKPGAPALQTRVLGTNSFELSFSSNPGWSYTLQSRSSLVGSQWQDLETGITGTGGLITRSPSLIGHATSFFRLVAR